MFIYGSSNIRIVSMSEAENKQKNIVPKAKTIIRISIIHIKHNSNLIKTERISIVH